MQVSIGQMCVGAVLTAADVRIRSAQVRAFRARVWPLQRPAALPAPEAPVLPAPASQDIDALRARLLALARPAAAGRITIRRVLEVTAGHFGTTVAALLSERRTQSLARHRQIAMFVASRVTERSLPFIGRYMGGRDHTTILHGRRTVQSRIDAGDAGTIAAVVQIIERLTGEDALMAGTGAELWT